MINYVLLGIVVTLCIAVVVMSERRLESNLKRARLKGMREGVEATSIALMQIARKFDEITPIDVESTNQMLRTQIELEEWAEL